MFKRYIKIERYCVAKNIFCSMSSEQNVESPKYIKCKKSYKKKVRSLKVQHFPVFPMKDTHIMMLVVICLNLINATVILSLF